MQISRRKFLGTTAAAGAAGFGLGVLVDRLAPHFSKKNITQIPKPVDPHDLEQAIQKYNSANLEEKSRILSEMYDGRAKLIPVSYDNQHEMLDGYYGDVWAVIHFGVLQVNGSGSQSGFSLNNTRESVTVDNHGRLRQAYGGDFTIAIPNGYSLLSVNEQSDRLSMDELLEGLRLFAEEYKVVIDSKKIGVIKDALGDLGYYPPI